jgi:hypothetical protein
LDYWFSAYVADFCPAKPKILSGSSGDSIPLIQQNRESVMKGEDLMSEAWIIDAARTPRGVGKQGKGALWEVHPQKLLSTVLKSLAERSDLKTR